MCSTVHQRAGQGPDNNAVHTSCCFSAALPFLCRVCHAACAHPARTWWLVPLADGLVLHHQRAQQLAGGSRHSRRGGRRHATCSMRPGSTQQAYWLCRSAAVWPWRRWSQPVALTKTWCWMLRVARTTLGPAAHLLRPAWLAGSACSRPPAGAALTTPVAPTQPCPAAAGGGCWLQPPAWLTGARSTARGRGSMQCVCPPIHPQEHPRVARKGASMRHAGRHCWDRMHTHCVSKPLQSVSSHLDGFSGGEGQPLAAPALLHLLLLLLLTRLRQGNSMLSLHNRCR